MPQRRKIEEMNEPYPFRDFVLRVPMDGPTPPVFPCVPWQKDEPSLAPHKRGKRPLTANGWKDYARTHDELRSYAEAFPDANVGYAPEPVGLCVIDVDGPDGENELLELELEHGTLPKTREVKTPRGRHIYFRGTLPPTTSKLAPHIDTRGRGSYVLAPGSVVNGATYHVTCETEPAELPVWIGQHLSEPIKKHEPSPLKGTPVDEKTLLAILACLDPDVSYQPWRNIVAGIRAAPLKDDTVEVKRRQIAVCWSRGDYWGSPSEEFKKKGREAVDEVFNTMPPKKGGIGFGSLVKSAREKGFKGSIDGFDPKIAFAHFTTPQSNGHFEILNASDVVPEPIEWFWTGRLARGKFTILSGAPGQGKSQISLYAAGQISNGGNWVDGGQAPKGRTIILSSEDGVADTMVPRLIAVGADLSKIHFIRATLDPSDVAKRRAFSLQADLDALGAQIKLYGDVVLVIIDPITSYMGEKTDTHQTSQVRSVLDPVSDWADRYNVAVLGISHPPKATQSSALNSVTGSLAFVGVARCVLCAIEDVSWPGHSLLLEVKSSVGPPLPGLRYSIEGTDIDGKGGKIRTSRIAWNTTVPVTISADEALAAGRAAKREPSKLDQSKQFLREQLQDGPMAQKDIQKAAEKEGFCWRTIMTAKAELGIESRKEGLGGGWVWELA